MCTYSDFGAEMLINTERDEKMDLRKMDCEDGRWAELAHDHISYRIVVVVLNLLVGFLQC
jgi:hypothetical protein